jgi:hypothetical protein
MNEFNEQAKSATFLPRSTGQRTATAGLLALILLVGACIHGQFSDADRIDSTQDPVSSHRSSGKLHSRPLVERDGQRLLWAFGKPDSPDAEWFDVTGSKIDPMRFQFGIGKDSIPAIDKPQFVNANDPRLREAGIYDRTPVIGYVNNGDARAYPLSILNRHELVNDTVGGKPVTVGW